MLSFVSTPCILVQIYGWVLVLASTFSITTSIVFVISLESQSPQPYLFIMLLHDLTPHHSFLEKGKKSSWDSCKSFPEVTKAFHCTIAHPFQLLQLGSPVFELLERYTRVLYDRTTLVCSVNELRQELFCKGSKMMENIPPTQVNKPIIICN